MFDIWPSFVLRDFELGRNVSSEDSTVSPVRGSFINTTIEKQLQR